MTNPQGDRLDRIETLLEGFIVASSSEREASNERMTRIEQSMAASDGRLTRIENLVESNHRESNERLTRIEQIVESNNKFLESFSTDLRRYTNSMNDFATRIDGVIATNNQDRLESNSRLAAIQRQVSAIARHLGVI
jgi:septation ring formation regulator EzrA